MNDDTAFEAHAGETWYEAPGCHHVRGENVSKDEEASFFAIFVIDKAVVENQGMGVLFQLDADMEGKERKGEMKRK